jgi:hypothetical protein
MILLLTSIVYSVDDIPIIADIWLTSLESIAFDISVNISKISLIFGMIITSRLNLLSCLSSFRQRHAAITFENFFTIIRIHWDRTKNMVLVVLLELDIIKDFQNQTILKKLFLFYLLRWIFRCLLICRIYGLRSFFFRYIGTISFHQCVLYVGFSPSFATFAVLTSLFHRFSAHDSQIMTLLLTIS